jgi:hypothetical protein
LLTLLTLLTLFFHTSRKDGGGGEGAYQFLE